MNEYYVILYIRVLVAQEPGIDALYHDRRRHRARYLDRQVGDVDDVGEHAEVGHRFRQLVDGRVGSYGYSRDNRVEMTRCNFIVVIVATMIASDRSVL